MKQINQDLRSGELRVEDVPVPEAKRGEVLVRVCSSVVSSGTERAAAVTARKSLVGKALERPGDVRQVLDKVRRDGLFPAYRAASARLAAPLALGYSAAGVVVECGTGVEDLAPGDPVACAGQGYASHAEWITVPRNLCARIPTSGDTPVAFDRASFATLGAIALHGVRQSEARLGEWIAVVGLGLVGNIATRLLLAAGCRVVGVEPNPYRLGFAPAGIETCTPEAAEARVRASTGGVGVDSVLVAASSNDADILEAAARLCRDRGRLVVVGGVPIQVSRELLFRREIELRISRSYGPGRYDATYEEGGIDYPIGYVRWTERRNLEAFLDLDRDGRLDLPSLVSHRFPIDRAAEAYDLLVDPAKPSFAILIDYPGAASAPSAPVAREDRVVRVRAETSARFGVGFLGAGAFAQAMLLPAVRAEADTSLRTVVNRRGLTARHVASRFGFERAATAIDEVLGDPKIDIVFVTGPNSTHAARVVDALRAGKHVFTEKPLCLSLDELATIEEAVRESPSALLMVGFNRRFAPATRLASRHFAASGGPDEVTIRVNAGPPPTAGWQSMRESEGSRILGEACHFVDLLTFFFAALPVRVYATRSRGPTASPDDVLATIEFANGRVGTIAYVTSGSSVLPKERIELAGGGSTVLIDDFRTVMAFSKRRRRHGHSWSGQDKGHAAEIAAFFAALRAGGPPPIPFAELTATTRATLAIEESIARRAPIDC